MSKQELLKKYPRSLYVRELFEEGTDKGCKLGDVCLEDSNSLHMCNHLAEGGYWESCPHKKKIN